MGGLMLEKSFLSFQETTEKRKKQSNTAINSLVLKRPLKHYLLKNVKSNDNSWSTLLWKSFFDWLESFYAIKGKLQIAVMDALNQKVELLHFLDDGNLEASNNLAKQGFTPSRLVFFQPV